MEKFLGKPKGQRAAVTGEGSGKEVCMNLEEVSDKPEEEGIAVTTSATLAKLMEQQRVLSD